LVWEAEILEGWYDCLTVIGLTYMTDNIKLKTTIGVLLSKNGNAADDLYWRKMTNILRRRSSFSS